MAYLRPIIASISGTKYSCQGASISAKTAVPADTGNERPAGWVSGIELQRADRERREIISQWRPGRTCGCRITRPPDTTVDSPDIEDVRVSRMRRHSVNRSIHLVIGGYVIDLPIPGRTTALGSPRPSKTASNCNLRRRILHVSAAVGRATSDRYLSWCGGSPYKAPCGRPRSRAKGSPAVHRHFDPRHRPTAGIARSASDGDCGSDYYSRSCRWERNCRGRPNGVGILPWSVGSDHAAPGGEQNRTYNSHAYENS